MKFMLLAILNQCSYKASVSLGEEEDDDTALNQTSC